eukprot:CAMPEP_0182420398 /NCGR_PEP_ID=MMETSP1167-20130531/5168_1 /TAXON_ID=2988 /ORGANISM="Mallomonas Sp, Strain CCMP3275" /LENGTH=639 /DNA_ID=CAMNT_0024596285 /DNA_START=114 /DNA_END=2033 /DNA_ORIENTATION=-
MSETRDGPAKREARFVQEFIDEPLLYYPKPEFLVNTFIEDDTVLTYAVRNQNAAAVSELIKAGVDTNIPNKKGVTPISAAAHKGNTSIIQALIEAGASVNALNTSGSTALIQASHFGHVEAVRLLLANNASSDFANLKGTTALMRASQEGHVPISKLLIVAGADVNRKNHEGMNALMLASQRGHADMVLLLIKSGASMDEQTSQGSTALMLACKRGHDKVAEVLVSMGAEIFMRDCRGRTARDTATRRQHLSLLCWLDTQVQVRRIQDHQRRQRSTLLSRMRVAQLKGALRLVPDEERVSVLIQTAQKSLIDARNPGDVHISMPTMDGLINGSSTTLTDCNGVFDSPSDVTLPPPPPGDDAASAVALIRETLRRSHAPADPDIPGLRPKQIGYEDWMWPQLLNRCMDLPPGVFELIVDLLPTPRIWQWSLWRLRRRCKLAPQQAVLDICSLMDEILADANFFAGKNQKTLLQRIARNPQIHMSLIEHRGMPHGLVEMLMQWADVQSLATRTTELEVGFKTMLARKMLAVGLLLFRWQRHMSSSSKALGLTPLAMERNRTNNADGSGVGEIDGLENGDACGEDAGSDGEGLMDQDQDTETEMPAEGDADEIVEPDSDTEDDQVTHQGHHGHGLQMAMPGL